MLIQEKIGNINSFALNERTIDRLPLEWYETRKRILRKQTVSGKEASIKFLGQNPEFTEGDILFADDKSIVAVSILPCDCIVIKPADMFQTASACYEIGNRHLPLFYENNLLLVPLDPPLMHSLQKQGYDVKEEKRKLLQPLKTTVTPHGIAGEILLSKNLAITSPA